MTYARLEKRDEGSHLLLGTPDQPYYGYVAVCLKCGGEAMDHYNW